MFSDLDVWLHEIIGLWAKDLAQLLGYVGTAFVVLFTKIVPWCVGKVSSRRLQDSLKDGSFPLHAIENALRFYVTPECQDIDPARAEEPRAVFGVRQNLFEALDLARRTPSEYRYMILLADSGMGKTCALINYYARHTLKWCFPKKICLVSLTSTDANKKIAAISDKAATTLLLDALDEDLRAVADHQHRVKELLELTADFPRVIITCRTQFFSRDEEIPQETGILKIGARSAGESAHYKFHKLYISPFSDRQVKRYLHKRYPWYRWGRRRLAKRVVARIQNLAVRPMLLSHIDDILDRSDSIESTASLYEEMIAAWLRREEGLSGPADKLLKFSERLAIEIYAGRNTRGGEFVLKDEIADLAKKWTVEVDIWKLSGRSLLNRNAAGHFKFAHRSILEYLFSKSIVALRQECFAVEWTDQMILFLAETVFLGAEPFSSFLDGLKDNWRRPNISARIREFLIRVLLDPRLARVILQSEGDKIWRYLALWVSWLKGDFEGAAGAAYSTDTRSIAAGDRMLMEFRFPSGVKRVSDHDSGIRMLVENYDYLGLEKLNTAVVRTSKIRQEGALVSLYLIGGFAAGDARYLRFTIEARARDAISRMQHIGRIWNRRVDAKDEYDPTTEFFFMESIHTSNEKSASGNLGG